MAQLKCKNKKIVNIDKQAFRELLRFPEDVKDRFVGLFKVLSKEGTLPYLYIKKITREIFEIRVRKQGAWRGFYVSSRSEILVVHFIKKKTQKTPKKDINIAIMRARHFT